MVLCVWVYYLLKIAKYLWNVQANWDKNTQKTILSGRDQPFAMMYVCIIMWQIVGIFMSPRKPQEVRFILDSFSWLVGRRRLATRFSYANFCCTVWSKPWANITWSSKSLNTQRLTILSHILLTSMDKCTFYIAPTTFRAENMRNAFSAFKLKYAWTPSDN